MAKPIRAGELHYPMIQFVIINISGRTLNCDHYSKETYLASGGSRPKIREDPDIQTKEFGLKKGGALDPPLLAILIVYIRIYDSVRKTCVFAIQFVAETYPASGASF